MATQSWSHEPERRFDIGSLRRLAIWGGTATLALLLAVVASYSDGGARRLAAAEAQKTSAPAPQLASGLPELEGQVQRLAALVDVLAIERERLTTRINTLERNLDDVTGAIKRQAAAAVPPPAPMAAAPPVSWAAPSPPLSVPSPPPAIPVPAPIKEAAREVAPPPTPPAAAAARQPPAAAPPASPPERLANAPAPPPPTAAAARQPPAAAPPASPPERLAHAPAAPTTAPDAADAGKSDFAVDVGGAANFDGLRVLWSSTRGANPTLVEGLYPLVVVRENSRTKGAELRLVVGPLGNVEAASRLCEALVAAHRYCQPVSFEGQRLADLDYGTEPAAAKPAPAAKSKSLAPPPPAAATPPAGPNLPRLFR
jgi:hypothetical protein